MRGVHSAVDDIRRSVFTEVARLAYESDDYKQVDMIPYKIVPGEVAHHRHDVFLERAIVSARLKLALGMDLDPNGPSAPISANIQDAATDQKYFNEPLVNIIPYACNACPPKQVRITDSCQGCISHPCMNVCPKDAIYLDENKRCHIDQSKCIKCGKCFNQCPYRAISKVERPCAAACGMDAIESDELGRAKINYDKCVSCGMCLVNCPFAAIADKSQIFQLIQAIKRGEEVIACVAPAFVGQYGPDATPAKLKAAMRILGFADVVEVAIGADLCTVEEAHDFLEEVPEKLDWMGTSCCPAWSMMAKTLFPQFKDNISMALTPMVITARMVKKDHPNARIVFIGPCAAKKLEANRKSVRSDVDFVLTFEELLGMFDAKEIDFKTLEADPADGMDEGSGFGRGFAVGGGVAAAVVEAIKHIDPDREILIEYGDGLKECRKMLAMAKAGKRNGYLLEGMGCPAWSMMAKTLFPQFKDNISMALTPMVITARMVKKDHPNARIVFIGPCAAKKLEANRKSVRSDVDFVLTFEELLGMFDAKEIDFKTLEADPADGMDEGSGFGRGFAVGGGVAAAVVEAIKHIDPDREILIEYGDGLKECRKMLAMAKAGKRNGYLLEGMGCPGGCVAGAGTLRPVKESTASVERFKNAASSMSTTESPYLGRLKDVEEKC